MVGNDECDIRRTFNITQAVEQDPNFKGLLILYLRFNSHAYCCDGVFYDHPLAFGHALILSTLHAELNSVYIYYDRTDGIILDILNFNNENNFNVVLRDCIVKDI